jgi:hypothetical protein
MMSFSTDPSYDRLRVFSNNNYIVGEKIVEYFEVT